MNPSPWPSILGRYPTLCRPTGPVESLGNAGGLSGSRLWRFGSALGRLCLRAWPTDGPDREGLAQIHGWLAIAGTLPFVPTPIPTTDRRTFVEGEGRLWELCPWMPGAADPARPPPPDRIHAAFAGLAAFHARFESERSGTSPGIIARLKDVEGWLGGDFARLRARLLPVGADPPSDLARAWLDGALRRAPALRDALRSAMGLRVPLRPCLRDARPDHFLFEGDRLTGLIDFGAMGIDSVAGDLARLLGEALAADRPAQDLALAAYRSVRPITPEEDRLIPVSRAANALLGAGRWARWYFLDGRAFDDPHAVVTGLRRGLDRMDESA